MALRHEEHNGFDIVGMKYVGKNENGEIGQMWGRFIPVLEQASEPGRFKAYGYCYMDEDCRDGSFAYVAGVPTSVLSASPDLIQVHVPAGRYAVYTHIGPASTLPQGFEKAYGEAKNEGLETTDYAYELYPEDFDDSETSTTEIWMGLK